MAQVHVEDVGTELVDTMTDEDGTAIDCSTASTKKIVIKRPDGTVIGPFDASFDTNGTNGALKYLSLATTFTIQGVYKYQYYVVIGGVKFYGNEQSLTVYPVLSEVE